jgi:hypothetical protein
LDPSAQEGLIKDKTPANITSYGLEFDKPDGWNYLDDDVPRLLDTN